MSLAASPAAGPATKPHTSPTRPVFKYLLQTGGQSGERVFCFNTQGAGLTSLGLSNLTFNMLTWAHSVTVTVSWDFTSRNGDFYQRHLQRLYKTQQCRDVDFSFSSESGKCVFVRSLCWPELKMWRCLCSLTEDGGRWAGHIKTRPGKAMAVVIVPCTKAEPSSSTWSHTEG